MGGRCRGERRGQLVFQEDRASVWEDGTFRRRMVLEAAENADALSNTERCAWKWLRGYTVRDVQPPPHAKLLLTVLIANVPLSS